MINGYLERELKHNISNHEIFECLTKQDIQDLQKIKASLSDLPLNNILIEFDIERINNSKLLNMYPYNSTENKFIWDRFVAIQVLKAIRKKHNEDISYLEEQEDIIYNSTDEKCLETIFANSNAGINSDGVKQLISITNTVYRMHFIIKECKNKSLYEAVSSYLDSQAVIMIYCDDKFMIKVKPEGYRKAHWIWNVYDYMFFDGFNDGMESAKLRNEKVLSDNPKQMEKKYEEV